MSKTRKVALVAVLLVGAVILFPASHTPQAAPAAPVTTASKVTAKPVPAATPVKAQTTDQLASFEKDNAIAFPEVTGREIKFGALWVYTSLPHTGTSVASRICGAYAQFVLVDPSVRVTFVRASDGLQLAKCGPGA